MYKPFHRFLKSGFRNVAIFSVLLLHVDVPPPVVALEDPNLKFPLTREEPGIPGEKEVAWQIWEHPGTFIGLGYLGAAIDTPPQPTKLYKGTKLIIGEVSEGLASWYRYGGGLTTASTRYPRGTYLRVTNFANGRSVIVKVNDYGPEEHTGRLVDLERSAFRKLAPLSLGVIRVRVEEIL